MGLSIFDLIILFHNAFFATKLISIIVRQIKSNNPSCIFIVTCAKLCTSLNIVTYVQEYVVKNTPKNIKTCKLQMILHVHYLSYLCKI